MPFHRSNRANLFFLEKSGEGFNEEIFWEPNSDGFFLVIQIESYFRQIYRGESSPSKFHLIATVWAKPGQNGRTWSYKKSKCPDDDSSSQGRSRIAPKNAVRCRSIMFKKNNQLTRVNPQAPANGEPSTGPIQSGRRKWDEEGLLTNLKKNLVNTKKRTGYRSLTSAVIKADSRSRQGDRDDDAVFEVAVLLQRRASSSVLRNYGQLLLTKKKDQKRWKEYQKRNKKGKRWLASARPPASGFFFRRRPAGVCKSTAAAEGKNKKKELAVNFIAQRRADEERKRLRGVCFASFLLDSNWDPWTVSRIGSGQHWPMLMKLG